jgi:hypothetical protein
VISDAGPTVVSNVISSRISKIRSIRYLLLDEQRLADTELAGQRNVAAALFRLENSRRPEDIERVPASLIDWLAAPEQDSLRRAFVVWLKRLLLPARVPGAERPNVNNLQEMRTMLAERVDG